MQLVSPRPQDRLHHNKRIYSGYAAAAGLYISLAGARHQVCMISSTALQRSNSNHLSYISCAIATPAACATAAATATAITAATVARAIVTSFADMYSSYAAATAHLQQLRSKCTAAPQHGDCRVTSDTPQIRRSSAAALPQPCRSFTAALSQLKRSVAAYAPQLWCSSAAALPQLCRNSAAALPQIGRGAATALPHVYRSASAASAAALPQLCRSTAL